MRSEVEELIVREVRRQGEVRSLFALAVEHMLGYDNAHRCVRRLAAQGRLIVTRDEGGRGARGRPLVLAVGPNDARQLGFEWPLHPPQRGQGAP